MLRRTKDERPEKFDEHGLADISKTLKSRPVGCDFKNKKGGAMNVNCLLRVACNPLEIHGGYYGGNDRRACSIIMTCLEFQDHQNYVQIPKTIDILIK